MAVVKINYDEGNTNTYKSVSISFIFSEKEKVFSTGNFIKDWYDLNKYIIQSDIEEPVSNSSSVDYFIMDCAKFDSAYLHFIEGKPVLKYIDRTKEEWYLSEDSNGIEFFVAEGTQPTWEELKKLLDN